ncbi:hypothetical protein SAMN05444157_1449 [Frankineae bacterium MT45]|nr:hypothetical protein SAMN05444157_1449 [Frankineae bacterium MT45]
MTTLLLVAAFFGFVVAAMRFLLKDAYRQAAQVIEEARREATASEWDATVDEVSALHRDIDTDIAVAAVSQPLVGWSELDDLQLERLLRHAKP